MRDKKTGGYILGQNIVFLLLVTEKVSIPVGFAFYAPDPKQKAWREKNKLLKKIGLPKHARPKRPLPSAEYPKKYDHALNLLKTFKKNFSAIKVKAVLADSLYGHLPFVSGVQDIWKNMQVITKMRKNQKVCYRKHATSCDHHFSRYSGWEHAIKIRGREDKKICAGGARLYVPSHNTKRFVIAMKYEGEKAYRYLMATDLSWNMTQVMEAFSIRWLIEVFFEDWSCYHGFCSLAKQCGSEGSLRPLILSLLFDHCFLFHADQLSSLKHQKPLATFGSVIEKSRAQALCHFILQLMDNPSPKEKLSMLIDLMENAYPLRASKKHLIDTEDAIVTAQAA